MSSFAVIVNVGQRTVVVRALGRVLTRKILSVFKGQNMSNTDKDDDDDENDDRIISDTVHPQHTHRVDVDGLQ